MANLRLYHGSNSCRGKTLTIDTDIYAAGTLFTGVFASPEIEVAESHGEHVYRVDIEEDQILANYELNYHLPYEDVAAAFEDVTGESSDNKDLWARVIEDDYPTWEEQELRGRVARELGYDAVEMKDEHGSSYLLVSTDLKLKKVRK